MDHTDVPPAPQVPQAPEEQRAEFTETDLVATLRRCCDVLDARQRRDDVAAKDAALCGRGLLVASVFLQTAQQSAAAGQGVAARGVDFVTAAEWLSGYYQHAAGGLRQQSAPRLIGLEPATASAALPQLGRVHDALEATSAMWREVAGAAKRPGYDDMVARYEAWCSSGAEPGADLVEYFGGAAPPTATYSGVLRLWTATAAGLASTVTSGQLRGGRQEVVVVTQLMVQTVREAAVLAAMLGADAGSCGEAAS